MALYNFGIAKINSINRTTGTPVMKSMDSITTNKYHNELIYHVLPAIKIKWPGNLSNTRIKIQQDNAGPHIGSSYQEILHVVIEMGLQVDLVSQPSNSPDLNVLVLVCLKKHNIDLVQKIWKNWSKRLEPGWHLLLDKIKQ